MYVCVHTCTQRHMRRTHNLWCFFSPKQVNCLFSTNNNRHTLFLVCLSLCSALLSVWGAMPKMLSYRSLSLSHSLRCCEVSGWAVVVMTESGKEVNLLIKRASASLVVWVCCYCRVSLSLTLLLSLSLFLLFVCAQLFSIVAISCFDSQTVKNLTTTATTTSNDNKTTVEKPHKC